MLFASFDFLIFFAVVFAGYWALRGQFVLRALWVTAASYFFYMAGSKPVDGPLPTHYEPHESPAMSNSAICWRILPSWTACANAARFR